MTQKGIMKKEGIELFVISLLGLFLEMACIRWLPSQVRVLSYYTNIVLLAAFLGLGIGYILSARKKDFIYAFPFIFLVLISSAAFFAQKNIEVTHHVSVYFWQTIISPLAQINLKWVLLFFFMITTLLFIPIGQQTGRLFDRLNPLPAYTINIFGSVTGILLYSCMSYNLIPPIWIFALFMILYLYFVFTRTNQWFFVLTAVLFVVLMSWISVMDKGTFWSPYYKIRIDKIPSEKHKPGFTLTVNNDYHQMALNLSKEATAESKGDYEWARLYELPFRLRGSVKNAMIVGAGTGNDVAAALRMNVEHIDAVDIDPLILKIGKRHHPEQPYNSPRVSVYNDDARSFFKKTNKKYDVIVFGFLDSHQLFSSMSEMRLDTYVYTVESIREACSLLAPDGILSVTFCVTKDWIGNRLYRIMKEATGVDPLILQSGEEPNGFTYVYNYTSADLKGYTKLPPYYFGNDEIPVATDNWPYFYLRERAIPVDYIIVLGIIALFSLSMILVSGLDSLRRFNSVFFLLGAGFLLFETQSITRMSLLFGSTWIVNSAVLVSIFLTILCANFFVFTCNVKCLKPFFILLFIAVAVNYFFPINVILQYGFFLKAFIAGVLIGLPIFFSGIIFITLFRNSDSRSSAMGSNLLGAMCGGILEYTSMLYGINSLLVFVVVFYGLALFLTLKKGSTSH